MSKRLYDLEWADIYGGLLDIENSEEILKEIQEFKKKDQRNAELEEQLKNAIVLPKELQVGNNIYWANEKGVYSGKIYGITKDLNYNKTSFNIWIYCLYDNGLTYYHLIKDYGVELFATKEEAEAKLKELGENDVKD